MVTPQDLPISIHKTTYTYTHTLRTPALSTTTAISWDYEQAASRKAQYSPVTDEMRAPQVRKRYKVDMMVWLRAELDDDWQLGTRENSRCIFTVLAAPQLDFDQFSPHRHGDNTVLSSYHNICSQGRSNTMYHTILIILRCRMRPTGNEILKEFGLR